MNTYHHTDLREKLLISAKKMLKEHGADGLSIRAIAADAGVSHNAPYRHFANKSELLAALAEDGYRSLDEAIIKSVNENPDDTVRQIHESAMAYVRMGTDTPELFSLMFGSWMCAADYPGLKSAADKSYQSLLNIVRDGIKRGDIAERDSEPMAAALWATVHGVTVIINADKLSDKEKSAMVENTVPAVINVLLKGILSKSV